MNDTPQPMIRLNKLVRASPERVFHAWTSPDELSKWWGPYKSGCRSEVTLDAEVGGKLRIEMYGVGDDRQPAEDVKPWVGIGEFTVFEPPHRLAFTWTWENDPGFGGNSLVTVELHPADNPYDDSPATEVILIHERLPSAIERSEHTGGWWDTLRALGFHVRGLDPREELNKH